VLLYALAAAALIVALTKPQVTVAVPIDQARVMLVFDQSGSMAATDVQPTRLDAARTAARRFLATVPKRVQVGAISYNQGARVLQSPTTDRSAVDFALTQIKPAGSTATGDALVLALKTVQRPAIAGAKPPPAAIVLLSDGKSVRGRDPIPVAQQAAKAGVRIYTVALGTAQGTIPLHRANGTTGIQQVPPDPETLKRIADISKGEAFSVGDSAKLSAVYERLGSQIAKKKEPREITAGFAGGALVLVVVAAMSSLFWFGRLP
jgi:Ca-activated chloride channel homolog